MEVKRKIEAKLTLGDFDLLDDKPQVPTFQAYAQHWVEHYVTVACKQSSQRAVRGIVRNHLVPYFGTQDMRDITRAQVRTFLSHKRQRFALNYVKCILRTLHTIFAHAIEEEVLDRNPATRLGNYLPDKQADPVHDRSPYTSGELARYLEAMQMHYPQLYSYFLCLARTGMRKGEALGLAWKNIQFGQDADDPHRFIHVRRTFDSVHHTFNTPKSGRTRRVDMSQEPTDSAC